MPSPDIGESGARARLAFRISAGVVHRSVATSLSQIALDYRTLVHIHLETSFLRAQAPSRASRRPFFTPDGIYKLVRRYALGLGLKIGAHALRATAATNALDHEANIAKVQEWLGHANIATTRIYDRRKMKPEDSPTFKVSY